ncbi:MAG TPA: hypothetical protein VK034_29000 [Enhygromyxa sp.]|nr:hypothetical protein [Enhygromyxa sp.]
MVVENAVWFEDREDCTLSPDSLVPLTMTADVSFDTRIGLAVVVTNNQSPNPGSNTGIDDSEVAVETAEVNLSFSGGAVSGSSFEVTVPNNSIPGGESEVFLIQIPTEVTQSLRSSMSPGQYETLEVEVVFNARKYGQAASSKLGEVQTRAFTYPIEICYGCLADCRCGTCPSSADWTGTCGFAQGMHVHHPGCDADGQPLDGG